MRAGVGSAPHDREDDGWGSWPQELVDLHLRSGLSVVDGPPEPEPPAPGSVGAGNTVRVRSYRGWTTRMWTPDPTSSGSWQGSVTFVPTDPACRTTTRSWWLWVTPTGRG